MWSVDNPAAGAARRRSPTSTATASRRSASPARPATSCSTPTASVLWQQATQDASSAVTGSSVYDFEGDGVADVVYADEINLYVYSGIDGAVKLLYDGHNSGTLIEYPIVADVDNDGQVEIVVVHNNLIGQGPTTGHHRARRRGQVVAPRPQDLEPARVQITNVDDTAGSRGRSRSAGRRETGDAVVGVAHAPSPQRRAPSSHRTASGVPTGRLEGTAEYHEPMGGEVSPTMTADILQQRGRGQPLSAPVRDFFESRMGSSGRRRGRRSSGRRGRAQTPMRSMWPLEPCEICRLRSSTSSTWARSSGVRKRSRVFILKRRTPWAGFFMSASSQSTMMRV
jgi:hypothetical protein